MLTADQVEAAQHRAAYRRRMADASWAQAADLTETLGELSASHAPAELLHDVERRARWAMDSAVRWERGAAPRRS